MRLEGERTYKGLTGEEVQNLRERTYLKLRHLILRLEVPPGSQINERALATALGVSTTPIKEALRRLEAEGLVRTYARRGTYVISIEDEQLREMGVVRAPLEGVVARLAAINAKLTDVAKLETILCEMRVATKANNQDQLADLNTQFHDCLRRSSGNKYLIQTLEVLRFYERVSRKRLMAQQGEQTRALKEHEAILRAISARDPETAEKVMRAHVERSMGMLPGAISEEQRHEAQSR